MGGSSSQVPMYTPNAPDPTLDIALIKMAQEGGLGTLKMQSRLAEQMSQMPTETWTPDIFGPQGALTQAAQVSAINAFKSREAEKQANPAAAAARKAIYQSALEDVQPNAWEKRMENWARTKGLENYLQRGAEGSFGQSAFGDEASAQGEAIRNARLARAQSIIGQQPSVGIDPGQAVAALQGAQAQAMQQRAGMRQMGFGLAQGIGQSATDYINQMMGATSQGVASNKSEWRNYQNALSQQAAQNYAMQVQQAANQQANTNALIGAGIGAVGTIAGSALAGPVGGAVLGGLTGAASKGLLPSGGYSSMGAAQAAAPYASSYSDVAGMGYVPRAMPTFSYFGTQR